MCIHLHIGVGFGVACLDDLSNARAIECETGNRSDSHAFCIYAVDEEIALFGESQGTC